MHWIFSLYVAFLFFVLTPAILVRLPPKGGKFTVAAFHALVFALVLHFTGKIVWNFSRSLEGFHEGAAGNTVTPKERAELLLKKNKDMCEKDGKIYDETKKRCDKKK